MAANKKEIPLPIGFKTAGITAGIKKSGTKDMALFVSDSPAAVAGTFTRNQVTAATVKLCKERLIGRKASAVIMNSGIANACTGEQGLKNATRMGDLTAEWLGVDANTVFVCSTGSIGRQLPMDVVEPGIKKAVEALSPHGGMDAAEAMMTTDTVPKFVVIDIAVDERPVRVTAFAKGAGMIEPNMATMLCYILTDASVEPGALQSCLSAAVDQSFNRITVDGDMSTNDTVLLLANGAAGNALLHPEHADWSAFTDAIEAVAMDLALKIVADGEGAGKVVTIEVKGAASGEDAEAAARSVANSLLVKTSWVGDSVNWGRIMDSLGYSKAKVDEAKVDISYDGIETVKNGLATDAAADELKRVVTKSAFTIGINLHLGDGEAVVYSCDCTEEYVRINV